MSLLNRLKNTRCYLAGAMEHTSDNGVGWRDVIKRDLESLRITWLDPTDKPTEIAHEDADFANRLRYWKCQGNWKKVSDAVRIIRAVDLRMVDIADFMIVNIDMDVPTCGTWEEIFWANRCMKPVIVRVAQGKVAAPSWLFGTIPHEMIFSSWTEVGRYLRSINSSPVIDDLKRWRFFNLPVSA